MFALKNSLFDDWLAKKPAKVGYDQELQLAAVKFAQSLDCEHMLYGPTDIHSFLHICNKLKRYKLRFALFDQTLNLLACTDNVQDPLVMLMLEDEHYHIIDSVTSETHKLCKFCLFHHNATHKHSCTRVCHICKRTTCLREPLSNDDLHCESCRIIFRNEGCKATHSCKKQKCRYCSEIYYNNTAGYGHICTKFHCRVCGSVDDCVEHKCSLTGATQNERRELYTNTRRLERNESLVYNLEAEEAEIEKNYEEKPFPPMSHEDKVIFIYYDIETIIVPSEETPLSNPKQHPNILVPAVVCAQSECQECVNDNKERCWCGQINWSFYSTKNFDCIGLFVRRVIEYVDSKKKTQIYLVAHNGGRFDHHFIMRAITTYAPSPDHYIRRGNAIIGIRLKNITVLDSYRFIPIALRDMPKAIGLDIEVSKDYFPYELASIDALENGLSSLPSKELFGYDSMSEKEKSLFDAWYNEQDPGFYNMKAYMLQYCTNDVKVLRYCCRKFVGNWYYRYNYNPFESYTLPSAVVNSMIKNTPLSALVPLTPFHGYNNKKFHSIACAAFLDVYEVILSKKYATPIKIEREFKISPKFYADGVVLLDRTNKVSKVIEFLGCYYHLCDKCGYNTRRDKWFTRKVFEAPDGQKKTLNVRMTKEDEEHIRLTKQRYCQEKGIEYIEFWEHELQSLSDEYKRYYWERYEERRNQTSIEHMNHRDALFGGRTEAFKLFFECSEDEVIEYHDVNGLYPYVLMEGRFPLMDPTFITTFELPYEGFVVDLHKSHKAALVNCKVLAPQDLLLPVLPFRCRDKLFFALCRSCTEMSTSTCEHRSSEREFEVNVTSLELELAIKKGYKITSIYLAEVYELCAGPNEPGLPNPHREFIGKAMAMKEYAEVTNNPSARYLAKLAANSYWGALGKNADTLSTKFFDQIGSFYDFLSTESIDIKDIYSLGRHLKLNYRVKKEMIQTPRKTSLITAIFVTSQARIKLYYYLDLLGPERVIYCDTDSVLWVRKKTAQIPFKLSKSCGDMSDEITKLYPNGYIHKFVSLGPKSYSYEIRDKNTKEILKSCMTMKGISFRGLNKNTTLTFDDMYDLLLGEKEKVSLEQCKFNIDPKHSTLHRESFDKTVQVTMNKRIILDDFNTYPYGYKRPQPPTKKQKLDK